jgi:nicotinamide-nucleotide amidase
MTYEKKYLSQAIQLLKQQQLSLSFAESMSAGKMASAFSSVKGSGEVIRGGIVSYHADIKHNILGVKKKVIREFTPESAECTLEMLKGLKKLTKTDVGIAITGLGSEGGSETPEKPVGSVFIAFYIKDRIYELHKVFSGTPVGIINKSIELTAKELSKRLKELDKNGIKEKD